MDLFLAIIIIFKNMCLDNGPSLETMKITQFSNVVGNLIYATLCARVDIVQIMVVANQFVANLGQPPWIIMKQKFPFFKQYS
jgi:hypothetical protein